MLEAVQDQIVDIGYVNTVFEGSKLPLAQINFVTPFGSNDLVKVLSIYDQLRSEIPQIDEAFLQNGQRLLATTGIRDFHLLSTFPINKVSDLKGRKIGAPGLSATWLDGTGAVAVSGSLSQYYNSLKTGVYDGILTFESAIAPFKFYEVAPIITKVGFGSLLSSAVTINEARWQSLPEEVQDAILDVSHEYQELVGEKVTAASQKSLDTAAAKGAEINVLAPEEVQKLVHSMPNLALNWAKNIDAKGLPGTGIINAYMKLSREAGITFVRDWDKE